MKVLCHIFHRFLHICKLKKNRFLKSNSTGKESCLKIAFVHILFHLLYLTHSHVGSDTDTDTLLQRAKAPK